tara:strand:+ start:831 stop:1007 length:177 start_codon:yes stop_codon:yes gene_type:complete
MVVFVVMTVLTVGICMMALWSSRTQTSRQDELDEMYRLEMECSHVHRMRKLQEDKDKK